MAYPNRKKLTEFPAATPLISDSVVGIVANTVKLVTNQDMVNLVNENLNPFTAEEAIYQSPEVYSGIGKSGFISYGPTFPINPGVIISITLNNPNITTTRMVIPVLGYDPAVLGCQIWLLGTVLAEGSCTFNFTSFAGVFDGIVLINYIIL